MKIAVAGFTTALLVFAVATALSEFVLISDSSASSDSANRPQTNRGKVATSRASRSRRTVPKVDSASALESTEQPTAEIQRVLREVRQSEAGLQANREALKLVLAEIRDEQQSVDRLRQQFSAEVAAMREETLRIASRKTSGASERPAATSPARNPETATTRPLLSVRDPQAVQDAAILIGRLAKQGGLQPATALLRNLKDRDAARVLTALSTTESQLALQLSQQLLASRNNEAARR